MNEDGHILTMKAARLHGPKDLRVEELPEPGPPTKGHVAIRVSAAGICGSDLHTYLDGRIGATVNEAPLVLGHEFAGVIESIADGRARDLVPGTCVAVDPAQPCGSCELCLRGHPNLCTRLRFCGLFPDDGCFRERIVMPAHCCHPLPASLDAESGALLEPLGVALHALELAKTSRGDTAVIVGAGPIGLLILQAARHAGVDPVYVIEHLPWRLRLAEELGGIPVDASKGGQLQRIFTATAGRGVDVAFEAAWADESVQLAAELTRPGGRLVLVGIPREDTLTLKHSAARRKGLTVLFSRRMKHTYPRAIQLVEQGTINVKALISHRFPLAEAPQAFALNSEYRDRVVKVMIQF